MSTRCTLVLALALCLLGGCGQRGRPATEPGAAETIERTRVERGPVTLRVLQSPAAPTLVDTVDLIVEVEFVEGVSVETQFADLTGDRFLVLDYTQEPDAPLGDGRWRRRTIYELEPGWSGEQPLKPLGIRFLDERPERGGEGEPRWLELATEPLTITIAEVPLEEAPSPSALRAPAPPRGLPAPPWPTGVLASLITVATIVVLALVMLVRRSRTPTPPPPPIPPRLLARAELDQLLRRQLIEDGRMQELYYELSAIVRRFVEAEYGVHAAEQTTEEFLGALARSTDLDAELVARLQRFAEAGDLVKYAAQLPTPEVAGGAVDAARAIIDHDALENGDETQEETGRASRGAEEARA